MKKVSICIATCNRNQMLRRCLDSVCEAEKSQNYEYSVVVVDNNDSPSAEGIVKSYCGLINIMYDWEPKPGIPFARNRCLEKSLELGADFISFIDDDEWVEPSWLKNIVLEIDKKGVDVISGGVNQEKNGMVVAKRSFDDVCSRDIAETDNVIFKKWIAESLKFDEDFAQTGGSDAMFFRRAIELGARIKSCPNAVVTEEMPAMRQGMKWRLQRHFRYGLTHCMIERKLDHRKPTIFLLSRAILLLPVGFAEALIKGISQGGEGAKKGIDRVMRGLGSLSYFIGFKYNEYRR